MKKTNTKVGWTGRLFKWVVNSISIMNSNYRSRNQHPKFKSNNNTHGARFPYKSSRDITPLFTGDDNERRKLVQVLHAGASRLKATVGPAWEAFLEDSLGCVPENLQTLMGDSVTLTDHTKILKQYAKLLTYACHDPVSPVGQYLAGHPASCQQGLDWFQHLCNPLTFEYGDKESTMVLLWRKANKTPESVRYEEVAYHLMHELPNEDPDLMRMCMHGMLSGIPLFERDHREFELKVYQNIIRTNPSLSWGEFQKEALGWKSRGLTHVLLMAAQNMTHLNDWLPVEMHSDRTGQVLECILEELNLARSDEDVKLALLKLHDMDVTEASYPLVGHVLDRLAILMRVKSNPMPGNDFDLDKALDSFPNMEDMDIPDIWMQIKPALEKSMPPSVLCAGITYPKRDTWGYPRLTLEVSDEGRVVRFHEDKMKWVTRESNKQAITQQTSAIVMRPQSSSSMGECMCTPSRLQDVIQRLGEIAAGPDIAHVIMFAKQATNHLLNKNLPHGFIDDYRDVCNDKELMLEMMDYKQDLLHARDDILSYLEALGDHMPKSTRVRLAHPIHLMAWRIDTPARVILFKGQADTVNTKIGSGFMPHKLSKVLLDERSKLKSPSRIHIVDGLDEQNVRDSVLMALQGHPVNYENLKRTGQKACSHVLEEAMWCFSHPVAKTTHSQVDLMESSRWEKDHEDHRYAETQMGTNGVRYRDWLCMYADENNLEKCKLDSHILNITEMYQALFPWKRVDGRLEWVTVRSSLPTELRVLHDRHHHFGEDPGISTDAFKALACSVKSRLLQDLKLLPVRDPSHKIDRTHVSVYTDDLNKQVLIVYTPLGDELKRLEFLSFVVV